ncbi:FlgO family outer membrane protein [Aestuariibacter sp. AA17]|uniref:FlgO family outer membrane protein n=1 Tax=Fluctibacter corallii TaxID=2984329 RepID=A0ABT3A376_9ALTE|nr:FlgO family outer membrane protein [Aestuariibacter sp. AA17]MCV2883084.1 FlgO family outer membrane protein [Aestuariibacter sp. AA17]
MKKHATFIILLSWLTACSSSQGWSDLWGKEAPKHSQSASAPSLNIMDVSGTSTQVSASDTSWHEQYVPVRAQLDSNGTKQSGANYSGGKGVYNGEMLNKHIGDYVQNMTQDLIGNMAFVSQNTPIGVTHFALIDSDLQKTNVLGFQLAESFIHELHKFRIPVIDYKATDYIRVTPVGDFFLSRDFLELSNNEPINYILTGTMTRHQGGYLINARVLGLKNKAVVASAQMLVPFYVVDALLPSIDDAANGVKLIQG